MLYQPTPFQLDSGFTDTLIDLGLVEHLGIQGILEQIGIKVYMTQKILLI